MICPWFMAPSRVASLRLMHTTSWKATFAKNMVRGWKRWQLAFRRLSRCVRGAWRRIMQQSVGRANKEHRACTEPSIEER